MRETITIAPDKPQLRELDPLHIRFFYDDTDRLRMTAEGDRSYITVKPAWVAPLTIPDRYLSFLDGKGEEIITLPDPRVLDAASLSAVRQELRNRYFTATVAKILHAKQEFGASYWTVESDRGKRDFVAQNLQENAQWLSDTHLLLIDVDGNRFEIPDVRLLDAESRRYLGELV